MLTVFDLLADQVKPALDAFAELAKMSAPADAAAKSGGRKAPPPAPAPRKMGAYFRFMSVDVRHGYYGRPGDREDAPFEGLVITPTPQTQRRLALYGLIARMRPDGIDILWDDVQMRQSTEMLVAFRKLFGDLPEVLRTTVFEPPLLFTVALAEPRFANFTDMPTDFRIGDTPLRLSNRGSTRRDEAAGTADILVNWDKRVRRPLPLLPPSERRGEPGHPPLVAPKVLADAKAKDLKIAKSFGALEGGPVLIERTELRRHSRHFALLDLHFLRALHAKADSDRWDGLPVDLDGSERIFRPSAYTLRFGARKTHWRYFVAARSGELDRGALSVVGPDGATGFAPGEPRILPDGRQADCLASTAALPILARPGPTQAFALVATPPNGQARPRTLVDHLPVAGIDSISPDPPPPTPAEPAPPGDGEPPPRQVWSDIYVFV